MWLERRRMTVVARENSSWLVGSKCRTVPMCGSFVSFYFEEDWLTLRDFGWVRFLNSARQNDRCPIQQILSGGKCREHLRKLALWGRIKISDNPSHHFILLLSPLTIPSSLLGRLGYMQESAQKK
jgi:hypothetical protein